MTAAPSRPSMSKARRVRIFVKEDGRCYLCQEKIKLGQLFEVEHVIPWALSFDDSDDNLKVAHTVCHRTLKTKDDVARIAKAKRQGRETGQQARRAIKGGSIPSRPFQKTKTTWPKRPFKGNT
jgi:5-methylcytosine-specific restriction protein A